MIRSFRSEWILLNRKKLWLVLGAITAVYTAVATALVISTAEPLLQQSEGGWPWRRWSAPVGRRWR